MARSVLLEEVDDVGVDELEDDSLDDEVDGAASLLAPDDLDRDELRLSVA